MKSEFISPDGQTFAAVPDITLLACDDLDKMGAAATTVYEVLGDNPEALPEGFLQAIGAVVHLLSQIAVAHAENQPSMIVIFHEIHRDENPQVILNRVFAEMAMPAQVVHDIDPGSGN